MGVFKCMWEVLPGWDLNALPVDDAWFHMHFHFYFLKKWSNCVGSLTQTFDLPASAY